MPYAFHPVTPPPVADPRLSAPNGTGPTMVPEYDAMGNPTGSMVEVAPDQSSMDYWDQVSHLAKLADDGMRMVANGMTFGMADRLAGYADYVTGQAESYDTGAKAQFDRTQKVREEHPYMAPAAELAGGLITGGGLIKNGVTIAGREGMALLPRMMAGAVEGGAYAAATGAGNTHSDRIEDYVDAAYKELETGALFGAGLPLLGSAAGNGVKWAAEKTGIKPILQGWGGQLSEAADDAAEKLFAFERQEHPTPPYPKRLFSKDYRETPSTYKGTNILSKDIDGNPLVADYIAGRRILGGDDFSLTRQEMEDIAEKLTGKKVRYKATDDKDNMQGAVGATFVRKSDGKPIEIVIHENIHPDDIDYVLAHELGHTIDRISGRISTKGLEDELKQIYHAQSTGERWSANPRTPQKAGYSKELEPGEYMAEAFRAYLLNPNSIKTMAPKTAQAIRAAVNENEGLKRVIQFNTLMPLEAGALGAVVYGSAKEANSMPPAENEPSRPDFRQRELQKALADRADMDIPVQSKMPFNWLGAAEAGMRFKGGDPTDPRNWDFST